MIVYSHSLLFASLSELWDKGKQTKYDGNSYNNNSNSLIFVKPLLEACKCATYHSERDTEEGIFISSQVASFYQYILGSDSITDF